MNNCDLDKIRSFCFEYINNHSHVKYLPTQLKRIGWYDIVNTWCKDKICEYSFGFKLCWFLYDITDFLKCKYCGKYIKKDFITFRCNREVYQKNNRYCSAKCVANDEKIQMVKCETNIKKYGCKNPIQNKDIQKKTKQTNLERYGVENVSQNRNIQIKREKIFIDKYGVDNPFKCEKIKEKIQNIILNKYGDRCIIKCDEIQRHVKKRVYNRFSNMEDFQPLFSIEEYTDKIFDLKTSKWRCKKCGGTNVKFHYSGGFTTNRLRCYDCNPLLSGYSQQEKELLNYIKTIYSGELFENSKSIIYPYEIDIYIPELKLAIEYNGDYFHYGDGAKDKPKDYHQMKYSLCKAKGIKLIFIRERNWLNRRDDVKDYLKFIIVK